MEGVGVADEDDGDNDEDDYYDGEDNDNDGYDDDDDNCFMWSTMLSAAPLYVAPWADRPPVIKPNNRSSSSPPSFPSLSSPWTLDFTGG